MSFKGCDRVTPSFKLQFKVDGKTPSQPVELLGRHIQELSRDERRRVLVIYQNSWEQTATWGQKRASEKANCRVSHVRCDHKPS